MSPIKITPMAPQVTPDEEPIEQSLRPQTLDEFVGQDHVSRAADGKKLGDSFNQSQQKRF